MLRQLVVSGDRRSVTLYWGARDLGGLYEHAWLSELARTRPGFVYRPVLSGTSGAASNARHGLVHEAVLADHGELSGFDVYASGPPAMIEAIRASFKAHGLPREQLFFDSFDYAPDTMERMKAQQAAR
jgi:CDP-4-dehydro-6-deoxyglucose reductase